MSSISKTALFNAIATALYVCLVGVFMFYLPRYFVDQKPSPLNPIFALMLFVFSAALTGYLMFGKPVLWYLDGKKKEALELLARTLGFFFVLLIIAGLAIFLAGR